MYQIGDAVVHPTRGAGIVVDIVERSMGNRVVPYYKIELLSKTSTRLMIPTERAGELGLRPAISEEDLTRVWRILTSKPEKLPTHSRKRYNYLKEKIEQLDISQIAEVIRDVLWMQSEEGGLKTRDRSIYQEAIKFLAGEIAAVKNISLTEAENEIKRRVLEP
ncbi:MAG: CarD family transcriptional regulator [Anaerolineae bacterium]